MNIKPKSKNQKYSLAIMSLVFFAAAFFVLNSLGFCYERHNGLYCYKDTNLNLVGLSLLFVGASILIYLAELKANRAISVLHGSLSLAVFCFSVTLFGVAVFMAGPNA
jgi:hypothetical protein